MATAETRDNKTEIVYPGEELFLGLTRMLKERTEIKIAMVSQQSGDIAFISTYADLGIVPQTLNHPFYHTSVFADFLGSLLVRNNLDLFSARIMDKFYDANVREYNHKHFGMRTTGTDALMFQCHSSLIFQLVNEQLNRDIAQEVAKLTATLACAKKVKRGGDEDNGSITSYCDNTSMRIIVPKKNEIFQGFETAIEMILRFYKITGKDVFVANHLFHFEIEIKDE